MLKTSELSFINQDIKELESSIVSTYEELANKKLFEGDPIRIFLQAITKIIFQQQVLIDFSAKQNLLAYATGKYLDNIVALVGVSRMDASYAMCTFKFTLGAPQPDTAIVIPKGTRVGGNGIWFRTVEVCEIAAGKIEGEVLGECEQAGVIGNNLLPGQITELADVFPFYKEVTNITTSSGGADQESDEALRQRAFEAPTAYSTAGSDAAYAFWAKTASQEISDVKVISPKEGEVKIIVLGKEGGQLSEEVINKVLKVCSDKKVKPLTDKVSVANAVQVSYEVDMTYYIEQSDQNKIVHIQEEVARAVERYISWQNSQLGRDINPNKLIYEVMLAGAKRVEVTSPQFTTVDPIQIPKEGSVQVRYGGMEDA